MQIRRCAHLVIELESKPRFALTELINGGDGLERTARWRAYAAHLDEAFDLSTEELNVLQWVGTDQWQSVLALQQAFCASLVDGLIGKGLLLRQHDESSEHVKRDQQYRQIAWWPLAAAAQVAGRWREVDAEQNLKSGGDTVNADLVENFGQPPTHDYHREQNAAPVDLPQPLPSDLDDLLEARITCRNFDYDREISAQQLSDLLHRVWGATGMREIHPNIFALRKNVPGGGGLHCTEAYVFVQNVSGLEPGLYHYQCINHQLEPMQQFSREKARKLIHQLLAGQNWFETAPVVVIMTARFERLFWKYREHAKAWRVAHLDIGHLSQTFYLAATELGLGAFVTAAINDALVEQVLQVNGISEAPIVVVGCGYRSTEKRFVEFDGVNLTKVSEMKRALKIKAKNARK